MTSVPFDPGFQAAIGGYPKGAVVRSDAGTFESLIDDNLSRPGDDATEWVRHEP